MNVLFNPVMCNFDTFQNQEPRAGYIYFVTDTRQLFVVRDGKFVELCGGINLVYGKKEIKYTNNGKDPDPKVFFYVSDLEDKERLPLVDDLILNKDGCFYRVKSIVKSGFNTERLTLQGTGGGGSGSGSGGSGAASFGLDAAYNYIFPDTTEKMEISFTANQEVTSTSNYITKVMFTLDGDSTPFYSKSGLYLEMNKKHTIDLIDYKKLFNAASKDVTIKVYDKYGTEREDIFSVQVINLQLVTTTDKLRQTTGTLGYIYTLDGARSLISPKIVYEFYNATSTETPVKVIEQEAEIGSNKRHELNLSSLDSGDYTMKVYGKGDVAGSTLTSNTAVHSIVLFKEGSSGSVLGILIPERVEQYTDVSFQFLIASDSADKQTITMSINGDAQDTIDATPGVVGEFVHYFDVAGDYTLSFNTSSGLSKVYNISVVAYEGELPIIKPNDPRLMLYLTPRGHTNDSTTRDNWVDASLNGAAANGVGNGKLTGLYYGTANGWLKDEDGTPYLKLTSGAKFELTDFNPFKFDPTVEDSSSNWQAVKMGSGMTIELDIQLDGITDYDTNIIECIGLARNGNPCVGFKMTGKTVRMLNSRLNGVNVIKDDNGNVLENTLLPLTIIENKRMRISYVIEPKKNNEFPMCLAYINGVLSGATIYSTTDEYIDVASPATLKINSNSSEVRVYGIRIYSAALESNDILNNYTASLATLSAREEAYKDNDVFNAITGKVDIVKVSDKAYNLQVPYMLLTGGYPTTKDDKWLLQKIVKDSDIHLPTGKKDYRMVDIEIHYPETDYFKTGLGAGLAGQVKKYINTFDNGLGMKDNLGKSSSTGYIMYGQGTSSMEYPVKNLRLRANKKKGAEQFQVRPAIGDVEIVCMKADYMDSSGSHNTGTANLVDDCYTALGIKTPGQEYFDPNGTGNIVTCIKGYPCLIFYSKDGEEYEYVGKYNLNLDKATPEPFGFKSDDSFGYLPEGYRYRSGDSDEWKTVQPGEKINSIHCFEFLDNATEVCNFLPKKKGEGGDETYTYEETWYNKFSPTAGESVYGWTLGFESRYPEDLVGKHDADALYPLASWLAKLQAQRVEEEAAGKLPTNMISKITYGLASGNYDSGKQYYEKQNDTTYIKVYPNAEQYAPNKYYVITEDKSVFEMDSLQEFKENYEKHFNKDFLLTYYVLTEALLMVDSRVKNMMIATWGPEKLDDGSYTENYIFYPIFYDMDTMLGLDNAGKERFTYYDEDTNSNIYNGDCVLWNFVRDALSAEINIQYNAMEAAGVLKSDKILQYYNDYQASMANEAFYNGDARYKYIDPAINGYRDDLGGKDIAPGAAPYLYAAKGDRNMTREDFIDNRIPYLRGKHISDGFKTQQTAEFRWNYPVDSGANNTLDKSIQAVPPDGNFKFTSMQTCYAGVMLGKNASGVQSHKFVGEETYTLVVPNASSANGTEAYLLGVNGLKDIGDLSSKYVQKFVFADSNNIKLEKITLGSSKQGYNNTFWQGAEAISLTGCTYLKQFDLRNCPYYTQTINFSPCPAIETILLTGSGVSGLTLPTNGSLKELRLPATISNLVINSHSALDKFSMGTYNYKNPDDLREEMTDESRYVEDYTQLSNVTIIDTPIDSYKILRTAANLNDFNIQGFKWTIDEDDSQYISTDDTEADSDKTYYVWNDEDKTYESFVGVWPTKDGSPVVQALVLEKVDLVEGGQITRIPLLDKLIKLREGKNDIATKLNGVITINIKAKVNEYAIYEKYHGIIPNVVFKYGSKAEVTQAYRLKFYNLNKFPTQEEIANGTYNVYYEVPCDSELAEQYKKLNYLVSAAGPNGIAIKAPTKMSTPEFEYEYAGTWQMQKLDDNYNANASGVTTSLGDEVVDGDYVFIPNYIEKARQYEVIFHEHDGAVKISLKYGYLEVPTNKPETPVVAYKPEDILGEDMRYQFKGWIGEADYNKYKLNPDEPMMDITFFDVFTMQMGQGKNVDKLNLYPYFEIENCREVASPIEWFNIDSITSFEVNIASYDPVQNLVQDRAVQIAVNGISLQLKEIYRDQYTGKLTIPSVVNGQPVVVYKGHPNYCYMKEVYFLEDSKCVGIIHYGFWGGNALTKVVLPKTLQAFALNSFYGCKNLTIWENYSENESIKYIGDNVFNDCAVPAKIPSNVIGIGHAAFANAKILNNEYISEFPLGVTTIGTGTFQGTQVDLWVFGHDADTGSLKGKENNIAYIGTGAFADCHRKKGGEQTLYLNNSIQFLQKHQLSDGSENSVDRNGAFYRGFDDLRFDVVNSTKFFIPSESSDDTPESIFVRDYCGNEVRGTINSFTDNTR